MDGDSDRKPCRGCERLTRKHAILGHLCALCLEDRRVQIETAAREQMFRERRF
jgi:hypothetical protein